MGRTTHPKVVYRTRQRIFRTMRTNPELFNQDLIDCVSKMIGFQEN